MSVEDLVYSVAWRRDARDETTTITYSFRHGAPLLSDKSKRVSNVIRELECFRWSEECALSLEQLAAE